MVVAAVAFQRLFPHQQSQPRKAELPGGIVNNIHLAGIEARLQLGKRHIELENRGFALRRIQLLAHHHRSFIGFDLSTEESDVGHQVDGSAILPICLRFRVGRRACRVVHLVVKIQMLSGGEYVSHVGNDLRSVMYQRVLGLVLSACL